MSGLDSLAPQAKRIAVAGRDFDLMPVKMRQLAAFSEAAMPVAPLILSGRMLDAATQHYEALKAALVIAAKADPDWLDDLTPDDFLRLAAAVVEVNADFFVRRLTPVLLVMQAKMQAALDQMQADQIGAPSSPILDATDMPSRLS